MSSIVALSTPPGRSGIGVIRLSGPDSLSIAGKLTNDPDFAPTPNTTTLRSIFDPSTGALLDQAVITYFKSPHSFTGDDIIDLSSHASPVLLTTTNDPIFSRAPHAPCPDGFTLPARANA